MTDHHDHGSDDEHSELSEMDLRVRALQTLLTQKGYIDPAALDVLIDTYQTQVGPRNGARVVARSRVEPQFRDWLLRDTTPAIASLGYSGRRCVLGRISSESLSPSKKRKKVHAAGLFVL